MIKPLRQPKDVVAEWLPDLSRKLGRSEEEILSKGIGGTDFGAGDYVKIRYSTGLKMEIPLAFALIRPDRKQAAVSSEHEGYLEFDLEEDDVVTSVHEDTYIQW